MNPFIVVLLLCSFFFLIRAAVTFGSMNQKRAYPPVTVLKQRAFMYGCFGAAGLLFTLLVSVFV